MITVEINFESWEHILLSFKKKEKGFFNDYVCVYVYVCETERDKETKRQRQGGIWAPVEARERYFQK